MQAGFLEAKHVAVGFLDFSILLFDQRPGFAGESHIEHFFVSRLGGGFASFAGGHDGAAIASGEGRLHIDPTAVKGSRYGTGALSRAAETRDFALQLLDKAGALFGIFAEDGLELHVADVLGGGSVTELTVLTGFDQLLQMGDDCFRGHGCFLDIGIINPGRK